MEDLSLCPQECFEQVLERYNKMVYRLAYARTGNYHDANDILQEVFLRYVSCKNSFRDEEHRKAWLIRVTVNCSKTMVTSSWNRRRSGEELDEALDGRADLTLEKYDTKKSVMEAVLALPEKYRTTVHLFYYEDLPIHKISEITGRSETAVKTQLHRARSLLKKTLEGVEFDD